MSDQGYLVFSSRIKEAYVTLSNTEKKVADYMLKYPQDVVHSTARDIAQAVGVSPATVVRFCRACDFSGLTELKLSLKREHFVLSDQRASLQYGDVKQSDPVSVVKEKVLGYHNMIIHEMLSSWNEDAYSLAVDALLNAPRILIFGEGGSRCTAICLFHILTDLGFPCETYMDSVFEIMKVGSLRENDVVIGITYTGRLRTTVDSLKLAKLRGATTIGLIGHLDSPIMEYVDIPLHTTKLTKDYYDLALSIRVSEISVIEILTTFLSMRLNRPITNTTGKDHVVSIRRISPGEPY